MRAKNDTEVRKAYLKFSYFLIACISLSVVIFSCFLRTSTMEVKRIMEKTVEYDRVYTREIELTNSMDSIYQYMKLMNSSPQINNLLLQSVVSTRKMNMLKALGEFDSEDCLLYQNLLNNVNLFLSTRDSIRLLNIQEEMIRNDLMQCIQDNWNARRNMNMGTNKKND